MSSGRRRLWRRMTVGLILTGNLESLPCGDGLGVLIEIEFLFLSTNYTNLHKFLRAGITQPTIKQRIYDMGAISLYTLWQVYGKELEKQF